MTFLLDLELKDTLKKEDLEEFLINRLKDSSMAPGSIVPLVIKALEALSDDSDSALPSLKGRVQETLIEDRIELYKRNLSDPLRMKAVPLGVAEKIFSFLSEISPLELKIKVEELRNLVVIPSRYIVNNSVSLNYGDVGVSLYPINVKQIVLYFYAIVKLYKEKESGSNEDLFYSMLYLLGAERGRIAAESNGDSIRFGCLRTNFINKKTIFDSITPMRYNYSRYFLKFIDKVQKIFERNGMVSETIDNLDIIIQKYEESVLTFSVLSDDEVIKKYPSFDAKFNIETAYGKIPVSFFQPYSIGTELVHTSKEDLEALLPHISNLFDALINSEKDDPEFINKMADFQYCTAHACPFYRGSAAIGEWFEMILFALHGFSITYKEEYSINLEALTSTLPEFIRNYPTYFELRPLKAE
jgi:hypothetical protein